MLWYGSQKKEFVIKTLSLELKLVVWEKSKFTPSIFEKFKKRISKLKNYLGNLIEILKFSFR